jgi:sphingosine kinase
MTTTSSNADNPFVDPNPSFEADGRGNSFAVDATLAVGKNASLTLGTDSLIVLGELRVSSGENGTAELLLDESFEKRDHSNCCGLWPSGT